MDASFLADLRSVALTGRHRLPLHAPWSCARTRDAALGGAATPWRIDLSGQWRFLLVDAPERMPAGWQAPSFADAAWTTIPVPANWELHGHGRAIYRNIAYPFPPDPPHPPAANPTGCYRTTCTIPPGWAGSHVVLEFGAVDSAFHVWFDGQLLGFSTDAKLPAAFALPPDLAPGVHHIAVACYRFPTSSYLEKQDYWHLSGIQRAVTLQAKPPVHLRDWCVRTQVAPEAAGGPRAEVQVRAWMSTEHVHGRVVPFGTIDYPDLAGWSIRCELLTPAGTPAAPMVEAPVATKTPMYGGGASGAYAERGSAVATLTVTPAQLWSAESPHLYTLLLTLLDPSGRAVDCERTRVGLRQVAIRDGILTLNGRRLVVRGVNRHEFHPERGRAVTRADMREDLLAMKRLNFNAVRTCHYPDDSAWYELCDELGMYVVDEANLETHGLEALLTRDPAWATAYLERAVRLCLRDRNHACIISWSLGNEAFYGPHHAAMAAWLREQDPTRPVQYESGYPPATISDILAPMYPQLDWVRRELARPDERRPMIMCEYAYAKGNSSGNIEEFWELVQEQPRFQGGFVWDWRDKVLIERTATGIRWRSGDPGVEPPFVERMCINGVVGPDLVPHPGAWAIAQAQAPVRFRSSPESARLGQVTIDNTYHTLDLAHLQLAWRLQEDGRTLAAGTLPAPACPPGASATVTLPLPPLPPPPPAAERFLEVVAEQAHATPWAPVGHAIARCQVRLTPALVPGAPLAPPTPLPTAAPTLQATATAVTVTQGRLRVVVEGASGALRDLALGDDALLSEPLALCLMRAPTDIDLSQGNGHAATWEAAGLGRLQACAHQAVQAVRSDGVAEVVCRTRWQAEGTPTAVTACTTILVEPTGWVAVRWELAIDAAVETLPRVGLATRLRAGLDQWTWFGAGPHEHYPDRLPGTWIDRFALPVRDNLTPYVFPQECGLRTQVRWLALTDPQGAGLVVQGQPLLHASALPVSWRELAAADEHHALRPGTTCLHLDGAHAGLGGDTGWTRNIHPPYLLPPGRYRIALRLRPLRAGEDPAVAVRDPARTALP